MALTLEQQLQVKLRALRTKNKELDKLTRTKTRNESSSAYDVREHERAAASLRTEIKNLKNAILALNQQIANQT